MQELFTDFEPVLNGIFATFLNRFFFFKHAMAVRTSLMRAFKEQFVPKPKLTVPSFLQASSSVVRELEIGSGEGEFVIQRAKNHPDSQVIAIEKSRILFNRMLRRYQEQTLPNLWIFHTNAVWWMAHFVAQKSLNKIYILYPNIYVKSRQFNLRWFNRPFMPYLLSCLKLNGELEIRTNEKAYYEECRLKMRNYHCVKKTQDLYLKGPPCTAFERKYMARRQVCRSLIYTRFF